MPTISTFVNKILYLNYNTTFTFGLENILYWYRKFVCRTNNILVYLAWIINNQLKSIDVIARQTLVIYCVSYLMTNCTKLLLIGLCIPGLLTRGQCHDAGLTVLAQSAAVLVPDSPWRRHAWGLAGQQKYPLIVHRQLTRRPGHNARSFHCGHTDDLSL